MDKKLSNSLFKTIAVGYSVGASVLFLPLFILGGFQSLATQADIGILKAIGALVLIPIAFVFQGLIFGGLVLFGLWVLRKICPSIPLLNKAP